MLEDLIREARGWLADCGLRVPEEPTALLLKINREYVGGWPEFVRADPDVIPCGVQAEIDVRYPRLVEYLYPLPDPTPTGDPLPIRG